MAMGQTDAGLARHEALVAIGRSVHRQASLLAFSDTIILQSILLGLALIATLFLKRAAAGGPNEAH
jgi:DHA2 family multidrug resistance protein